METFEIKNAKDQVELSLAKGSSLVSYKINTPHGPLSLEIRGRKVKGEIINPLSDVKEEVTFNLDQWDRQGVAEFWCKQEDDSYAVYAVDAKLVEGEIKMKVFFKGFE